MYYAINYDEGYVVTLTRIWEDGMMSCKPLRKFLHQGDAMIFKIHDCPKLSELHIKALSRDYDPRTKYIRINGRRFVKHKEE